MFSLDGRMIGDAWYYNDDGTIHTFFLTKPDGAAFGLDIGHAVSRDLVSWEYLGFALTRGELGSWDDKNLATGGVIRRDGKYWMAYTGHKMDDPILVQRVGVAVSNDLTTWEKLRENPTSEFDPAHYEVVGTGQRKMTHWRDPGLLDTGDEVFHYVCARRLDGDVAERGTVGVARSTDMVTWEPLPPPEHDRMSDEMEVPQVYAIDDRYYLVFCSNGDKIAPSFRARFPGHPFRDTDFSMVGDSPLGPFRIHGTGEIMPKAPPYKRFYASQLVQHEGEWFLLGTILDHDGRTYISDPIPVMADETGVHVVE